MALQLQGMSDEQRAHPVVEWAFRLRVFVVGGEYVPFFKALEAAPTRTCAHLGGLCARRMRVAAFAAMAAAFRPSGPVLAEVATSLGFPETREGRSAARALGEEVGVVWSDAGDGEGLFLDAKACAGRVA